MLNKLLLYKSIDIKGARRLLALARANQRSFCTKPEVKEAAATKAEDAKEQPESEKEPTTEKEDDKNTKSQTEEAQEEYEEEYEHQEESANFSTRRKIWFAFGKTIKYSIWSYLALFAYHFYLVKRKEKPEESPLAINMFLRHATQANWHIQDLTLLLTRPPVEKLMPDKPPLPPHVPYPKTLIIGLRGVSVHSEYLLGVGFEFKKRPGLTSFLQRMARCYEVVVFGDEESSLVQEICEALDPDARIIVGRLGHESTLLKDGKYVKDLSYMNRDIKDIVCIDFDDEKFSYHKRNVIKVPKWNGKYIIT
jgi:import inner membrane translocase subunit TIM50